MKISQSIKRVSLGFSAIALALASLVPTLGQKAFAYGQITNRAIQMTSSALGATGTDYFVTFNAGTSATIKSIAVDFCQNTPIIGDSCTGTVGTNTPTLTSATVVTTGSTGAGSGNLTGTWTLTLTNSNRTLTIANSAGMPLTQGTNYYFTIKNVTNPTDNDTVTAGNQTGTFYSRVLTFPNDTTSNYAGGYTGANIGTNIPTDAGGIALSTASQITITAKVQERLSFCVYTLASCAAGGNTVTLGDTNGVLDPSGPFVDKNTKYDVSTNASQGVVIALKGDTLTSGSNTITALGATKTASAAGTEQFGLCTYASTGTGLTPDALYNGDPGATPTACSGTTQTAGTGTTGGDNSAAFAFDNNSTTGTASTYGQKIATKAAGSQSTGVIAFLGNISNTTEAGIYTTTLTFIATGTY